MSTKEESEGDSSSSAAANSDSDKKIDDLETLERTRKMLHEVTARPLANIKLDSDLAKDLLISNKRTLQTPIEEEFAEYDAVVDAEDLITLETVDDLADRIYSRYIPESRRA